MPEIGERKPKMKMFLIGALTVLVTLPALASGPKETIEARYAEITKIMETDKTDEGVRKKLTGVLESFTDFTKFSKMTLKKHWKGLTDEQKTLFIDRYQKLLQKSYVKHFKAGQQLELTFRGEPKIVGTKAMVLTNVKSGTTVAEVDYKLHLVGEKHMAYDIVIDEVSLMRNYRKQFGKIMKRDGFKILIEKIEKKLAKDGDATDSVD
jgi:phospholipid transport system substrate-binding protein